MKSIPAWLILSALVLASCAGPLPELPSIPSPVELSTSDQLQDRLYAARLDSFYSAGIAGSFIGEEHIEIHYRIFLQKEREKGAIMISSGRTEAAMKYRELIYDLAQQGYSIYIHDHRGQGLSGRMADDPEMGHVDDFDHFVLDMKTFYEQQVKGAGHSRVFLLAHSMGGAIGAAYIERYPEDFQAAVLASPMLGLAAYICPLARVLSSGDVRYAPGQGGYAEDSSSFGGNSVTSSAIRFHRNIRLLQEFPEARLGGPTVQWLKESCRGMRSIRKNTGEIEIPILLLSAELESVVNPLSHRRMARRAEKLDKDCRAFMVKGARHEIFMESDGIRLPAIAHVLEFYSAN